MSDTISLRNVRYEGEYSRHLLKGSNSFHAMDPWSCRVQEADLHVAVKVNAGHGLGLTAIADLV